VVIGFAINPNYKYNNSMTNKHYTYAKAWGNSILYRGIENGVSVTEKRDFSPTLYIPATKKSNSPWRGLYDNVQLEPVHFGDIKEAKNFISTYEGVEGIEVHGIQRWEYAYLNQEFPGEIEYDTSKLNILTFDIEVVSDGFDGSDESFPDIQAAETPIVLISYHSSQDDKTTVLGLKPYNKSKSDNFNYIQFSSEKELVKYFIVYVQSTKPDIMTGWNIDYFDIPYLLNRIIRLFDDKMAKKLSPFNIIQERTIEFKGKELQTYIIAGIVSLDLLECYKKFASYNKKESYALGFIAQEELGHTKGELPGASFRENYNDYFDQFVQYSGIDTLLVKDIDKKLKLIDLVFAMAYMFKCNLSDVYKTVLPWEVFIFNHLHAQNIPVPPRRNGMKGAVEGAWVKEPKVGMHGWTMSFDFSGLYPSIIRQWNISPETFRAAEFDVKVKDFLDEFYHGERIGVMASTIRNYAQEAQDIAREHNCTIAANGTMYSKGKIGFLAELVTICMEGRKIAKKEMIKLEQEYQKTKDPSLLPRISALNNKQMALKIAANSVYGAIGNEGFAYFDYRMAEAITLTGQLSDMHLANAFNLKINKLMKSENIDYVIYADTDSVYLNCQPIVDKFCVSKTQDQIVDFLDKFGEQVCQPIINASIDELFERMNCAEKIMGSKREAIASKVIFTAKKKYAMKVHNSEGVVYNPAKLKTMGLEIVRSSTPQWCRKKLKDSLQMIFDTDEKTFRKNFEEIEKDFKLQPADVVAFPRGISDIDKYQNASASSSTGKKTGTPIHVRAAMTYNKFTKQFNIYPQIQNGDRIKFIYMKLPNTLRENVFAFPTGQTLPKELKLEKYVDYDTQFLKTFENPLRALTDAAGWKLREESSLESFFV